MEMGNPYDLTLFLGQMKFSSCKLYSSNYKDLSYYFVIWDKISGAKDVNSKKQVKHYTWVM